jgi:hypothetical protein
MREFKDGVTGVEEAVSTKTTTPTPPQELPAAPSDPAASSQAAETERETVS